MTLNQPNNPLWGQYWELLEQQILQITNIMLKLNKGNETIHNTA